MGNPAFFVRFLAGEISAVALVFFFFSFFPSQLTLRSVTVVLALCFIAIGVHPCTASNSETFYYVSLDGYMFQIVIAQMLGDVRPLVVPLLVMAAVQTYTMASTPLWSRPTATGSFPLNTVLAGIGFILITALPTQFSLREQARQEVLQAEVSKGEATAKSLLSSMCDAVIKLKSDLTLSNPSAALEALLLRTSTFTRGACWYFPSCVLQGEVARVEDFLNHNDGEARSFHTTLVDALGTKVAVQLFHAPMTEMDRTMSHLLGILEDSKDGFQQYRAAHVAHQKGLEDGEAATAAYGAVVEEEKVSMADTSSNSSSSAGSASATSHRYQDSGISNWAGEGIGKISVDVSLSLNVQVCSESEHSRLLFGFGDGQAAFLSRFDDRQRVLGWLEALFCDSRLDKVFEDFPAISSMSLSNVKVFNPQNASSYHAEIVASCLETRQGVGDHNVSERLVRLQLKEMRSRKENDNNTVKRLLSQARGKHRRRKRTALSAASHARLQSGPISM